MCAVPIAVVTNATGVIAKISAQNLPPIKFRVCVVDPGIDHRHPDAFSCVSLVV